MLPINIRSDFERLLTIIIAIFVFSGYFFSNQLSLLISILFFSLLLVLIQKERYLHNKEILVLFLILLFYMLFNVLISETQTLTFNTLMYRSICLLIAMLFLFLKESFFVKLLNAFFVFSFIHVALLIIQFSNPKIFNNFIQYLPEEIIVANQHFYNFGSYSGVTSQTGVVAFFICINLLIVLNFLLFRQSKWLIKVGLFLLLSIDIFALMLTDKRGHLIACMVILSVLMMLKMKHMRKYLIILSISLISIIVILFLNIKSLMGTNYYEILDDISSGRLELYIIAWNLFVDKPFLGWGLGYYNALVGLGTHNMYLQVLSELGTIGLLILVGLIIFAIVYSLKNILSLGKTGEKKSIASTYFSFQLFFCIYAFSGNPFNDIFIFLVYCLSIVAIRNNIKGETK